MIEYMILIERITCVPDEFAKLACSYATGDFWREANPSILCGDAKSPEYQ